MKLYHYSTERFPILETRRKQGVAAGDIMEAERKAKKMGIDLPYVDHISFFLEPIPKETIAAIFDFKHGFWKAGAKIFEHVIDTSDIEEKSYYRIVETPVIDKFTDRFDWTIRDLAVRSKYFVSMNKEMTRLGYSGYGISKMTKMCEEFFGKTEGFYLQGRMRYDADSTKTMYASNVPHLMIYPIGGVVKVESSKEITLGSVKPMVKELVYHLSFRENLPTVLSPRHPDGSGDNKTKLVEKLPPRISFSPSIQQCFSAIYPNISKYFEEENYPHMDMYVYCPLVAGKRIPNDVVLEKVWDSHITGEVCYTSEVKVIRIGKIRILNPGKKGVSIHAHPFNNPMAKLQFISPVIEYQILNRYYPVVII